MRIEALLEAKMSDFKIKINLNNVGKRYNYDRIFKDFNYQFLSGERYAITGPNGSGKSTLLHIISGFTSVSEGNINFSINEKKLDLSEVYEFIAWSGPYIELIEDLSLEEHIAFHFKFKQLQMGVELGQIPQMLGLTKAVNKELKHFSSGMKQRLKLGLAILSNAPILLLDEPTTNLDDEGIKLYLSLMRNYSQNRLTVISSNQLHEYDFCQHIIDIAAYK